MTSDLHERTRPKDHPYESPWKIHFGWHWVIEYLVPALLVAAATVSTLYGTWKEQERQRQEETRRMEEDLAKAREAVRKGQTGEAAKRLFSEGAKQRPPQSPIEE
jgi:hypothetical protein